MASPGSLNAQLVKKTSFGGLRVWAVIGFCVICLIILILTVFSIWVMLWRRMKRVRDRSSPSQIPNISREIAVDQVVGRSSDPNHYEREGTISTPKHAYGGGEKDSVKSLRHLVLGRSVESDDLSQCSSVPHSGDEGGSLGPMRGYFSSYAALSSPLAGLPEFSHLGWGHWFTLRDIEHATNHFSKDNILGEGGYGVVYRGCLLNGAEIAVKKLLNHLGQAEKEFRVEVEAIGHVRHKNLVRLLGYCIEGTHRMLVYEFVSNGNLEQWLHGYVSQQRCLSWERRIKVILGTAKALAYLHEAIEPKVVHRDIKSSNILIDEKFNAKVSDFGLAKLLGSGKSHVTTRVMGTFGYVAPEYANTGLLNEKSDVYSFGVLLLEAVTGRDPVDYGRPTNEVNVVDWVKMMAGSKKLEEVVDRNMENVKPSTRVLKRSLVIALRCVDPDSSKRPRMGQVVQMLEDIDEVPLRKELEVNPSGCLEITISKKNNPENSFERLEEHSRRESF